MCTGAGLAATALVPKAHTAMSCALRVPTKPSTEPRACTSESIQAGVDTVGGAV